MHRADTAYRADRRRQVLIPLAQRLRCAGSLKPVNIEGKPEGTSTRELLKNGALYEELRARRACSAANRSGALNELEYS